MPVMEGKAMLFKEFAGVDAFPICLDTTGRRRDRRDRRRRSRPASAASTSRTSPRRAASRSRSRLREALDIPVFHDDQHGTAIVVLAALLNALRVVGKRPQDVTVVITGRRRRRRRGDTRSCSHAGVRDDRRLRPRRARIYAGRPGLDGRQGRRTPSATNPTRLRGHAPTTRSPARTSSSACRARAPSRVDGDRAMADDAIVFAMANPTPGGRAGGARRLARGRRDRPLGLPEPDQQRARVPGHLPRRARRARARRSPRR